MDFLFILFLTYSFLIANSSSFSIYWNVPTEMCHKHGYNFSKLTNYGLIQNTNDLFRGEKITILYDPGYFPAIIGLNNRNGGVPQEGNFTLHFQKFKNDLISAIPDKYFSGVGVIDFEEWRPIYRENWSNLDIYRSQSVFIEKENHPTWSLVKIRKTAEDRFEKAAYKYFEGTLALARKLRPRGIWGYYGFPFCYNFSPKNPSQSCLNEIMKDNDRSTWLYETGNGLFPSIYLRENELNPDKRIKMIRGRLEEAKRLANKQTNYKIKILPYFAIKYQDTFKFLTKEDMSNGIKTTKKIGVQGIILWGSSHDTNTAQKCKKLEDYVKNIIQPIINK